MGTALYVPAGYQGGEGGPNWITGTGGYHIHSGELDWSTAEGRQIEMAVNEPVLQTVEGYLQE